MKNIFSSKNTIINKEDEGKYIIYIKSFDCTGDEESESKKDLYSGLERLLNGIREENFSIRVNKFENERYSPLLDIFIERKGGNYSINLISSKIFKKPLSYISFEPEILKNIYGNIYKSICENPY
ncbi:hypothetical protein MJ1_0146 [Nanobdella aerobiophila]|uniref:Uncharacterized protein n=1 Tax=Nanobdella aerobiophila TaxID=2586965 RepID=A0A915SXU8_9ARCH|nr:hypothetical protein [Nanobdella aerobiophila]BBL45320.1 hypothetical protein MJ1_0146 [Nanobdella aerobiophila]